MNQNLFIINHQNLITIRRFIALGLLSLVINIIKFIFVILTEVVKL